MRSADARARACGTVRRAVASPVLVRVLLIEDNPKMAEAIRKGFAQHGYVVDACHTGFEGEEAAVLEPYDVVILDLMLPDRDGLDVCRNLRRRKVATPILMLTALSGAAHAIAGLDAGADDYLPKPFNFDELVARVRALLRRGEASEAARLAYGDLELDLHRRSAARAGEKVRLSAKEFALLEYLIRNADRVVPRHTIAEKVWDMNDEPSSNVIDVYISALRRKLDRDFGEPLIHTVVGTGYRLGAAEGAGRR
jgi:DNA-binding response OmpR family regulator